MITQIFLTDDVVIVMMWWIKVSNGVNDSFHFYNYNGIGYIFCKLTPQLSGEVWIRTLYQTYAKSYESNGKSKQKSRALTSFCQNIDFWFAHNPVARPLSSSKPPQLRPWWMRSSGATGANERRQVPVQWWLYAIAMIFCVVLLTVSLDVLIYLLLNYR